LLRRAGHLDASTLTAIRRDAILVLAGQAMGDQSARRWAESSAEERVLRAIEQHVVWVAERDGVVVGWVEVDQDRIEGLYVRSDLACRGIGSTLLARAEGLIEASGHSQAVLKASSNAEEFYLRRGYEPQSERPVDAGRPMVKLLRKRSAHRAQRD
jgi:putative acetyltransferase